MVFFVLLLISTELKAQTYTLETVSDKVTPIPGAVGNFDSMEAPVSLDIGRSEVFKGSALESEGIYTSVGGMTILVADENTPIPGGVGTFTSFVNLISIGDGDVAFIGTGTSGQKGIYAYIDGDLSLVADLNTAKPDGTGNFTNLSSPVSLGGGEVAVRATGSNLQVGIYNALLAGGMITIVKETDPDGGTGFRFTGTDFPEDCSLAGAFTLDDDGFEDCDLPVGSYTVQETGSEGYVITDIECEGASSYTETEDSVTVNLMNNENIVCTFTNTGEFNLNVNLAGDGVGKVTALGIDCGDGGSDFMETYSTGSEVTLVAAANPGSLFAGFSGDPDCEDGVVTMNSDKTCIATFNHLSLILGPVYPGIKNSINFMPAVNATPGGSVGFIWGFATSPVVIGAPCPGLELGINPFQVVGYANAGDTGVVELKFFIPSLGNTVVMYTQAVDLETCRASEVVKNILRNN